MLKIENLHKAFGGVVATSDVSIHFKTESLTAVIGPNGVDVASGALGANARTVSVSADA